MERDTKIPSREEIRDILELRHGKEIQQKLSDARVAVAGLGGLGSNVAVQLARTGVGHLHLIDYDCVDLSNLNRQHYFIRGKTYRLRNRRGKYDGNRGRPFHDGNGAVCKHLCHVCGRTCF